MGVGESKNKKSATHKFILEPLTIVGDNAGISRTACEESEVIINLESEDNLLTQFTGSKILLK